MIRAKSCTCLVVQSLFSFFSIYSVYQNTRKIMKEMYHYLIGSLSWKVIVWNWWCIYRGRKDKRYILLQKLIMYQVTNILKWKLFIVLFSLIEEYWLSETPGYNPPRRESQEWHILKWNSSNSVYFFFIRILYKLWKWNRIMLISEFLSAAMDMIDCSNYTVIFF